MFHLKTLLLLKCLSFILFLFRKRSIFATKDRTVDSRTCIYRTFNLSSRKVVFSDRRILNVRTKLISLSIYKFWCGHTVFSSIGFTTTSARKYVYRSHLFLYPVATHTSKNKTRYDNKTMDWY